jgi:hypothetical protein
MEHIFRRIDRLAAKWRVDPIAAGAAKETIDRMQEGETVHVMWREGEVKVGRETPDSGEWEETCKITRHERGTWTVESEQTRETGKLTGKLENGLHAQI